MSISKFTPLNRIINCEFVGRLDFFENIFALEDLIHILEFHDCSFELITLKNCSLQKLLLKNVEKIGPFFSVQDCNINIFEIDDFESSNTEFTLDNNNFKTQIHIKNMSLGDGTLNMCGNTFPQLKNNFNRPGLINSCQFKTCNIYNNDFGIDLAFINNTLKYKTQTTNSEFKECVFGEVTFHRTDFGYYTKFSNCSFKNTSLFEKVFDDLQTSLHFEECVFKSHTSFNRARLHRLNFEHSIFESSAFFQDAYLDSIKLDNSIFEKSVFFDNVIIKDIYNCDRRTIRNIKLHLQKAENRIDYNKFRVYEFEAYKKDLRGHIRNYKGDKDLFFHRKREIKHFKRDLFILKVTGFFSDYGTDWKRALKCTIIFGIMFYSLLFASENYYKDFQFKNIPQYATGYFRFLLVTDFYNPLIQSGREYISNDGWNHIVSWFFFILGKIVIAFGIYEMIQAFRKFKA